MQRNTGCSVPQHYLYAISLYPALTTPEDTVLTPKGGVVTPKEFVQVLRFPIPYLSKVTFGIKGLTCERGDV